ncbi:MAG: hypothetical protein ABIG63_09040 [Chloroflexota bacterium]
MPAPKKISIHWKQHQSLGIILILGIIHGLLYVYLVPPWQHYDEPSQLEYAWLIADTDNHPKPGDYNQAMRREAAASMIEHDFFSGLDFVPNLLPADAPAWIGISQISDAPLYFQIVSLPLRLIRGSDITFQFYISRMVSLVLFLVSIVASYGVIKEITPDKHPLRWMVPLTLALLPSYVDLMTAVNNDVGATAFFSLFLWGSVAMIRRGFSWPRFLWIGVAAIVCGSTKNTVMIAYALVLIPVLFGIFRDSRQMIAWSILIVAGIGLLLAIYPWGQAANWVNPKLDTFINKIAYIKPSLVITSIRDWENTNWYYQSTLVNLGRTFWAKFGWGHVSLIGSKPYRLLGITTLLGVAGALGKIIRHWKHQPCVLILLFGAAMAAIWGAALTRGLGSIYTDKVFIPAARYAYPAIIPTVILLNSGWLEITQQINHRLHIPRKYILAAYVGCFLGLDILSAVSIMLFYASI